MEALKVGDVVYVPAKVVKCWDDNTIVVVEIGGMVGLTWPESDVPRLHQCDPHITLPYFGTDLLRKGDTP